MRKRFEVEVSAQTKLFFLSGIKGKFYNFRDIHNLSRLVSVIIPRELEFKRQHPHVLVDRREIVSGKERVRDEDFVDVALFGYLRGEDMQKL